MIKCSKYTILIALMVFSFVTHAQTSVWAGYRQIPTGPIERVSIPAKLITLHSQWNQTFKQLVQAGKQPKESYEKGYLDSDQPELQSISKGLVKYANEYNSTLLYIVKYSNDSAQRSQAAELLSWSAQPEDLDFILQWNLMNDPVDSVRQNLMKCLSSRLTTINDKPLLKKTIQAFCQQTTLPSFDDKNKALFSLQSILLKHQDLISSLHYECRSTICCISKTTILPNASLVAKDILQLVDNQEKN